MKVIKKIVAFALVGLMFVGYSIDVRAEEILTNSSYVPNENTVESMLNVIGTELQNGDEVVIGDYTIEYQEEIVCLNPYSRATTKDYVSTSHYKISNNGNEQEWYKVVQTTNYTYDGKTAKINTADCLLSVTTYYSDCSYTVDINTVDNSSSTDPTYTIGLTMKLPSQYITIKDVVTVHADGTHNKAHYS